jgi:polyisoprenoid-binding protein YceI
MPTYDSSTADCALYTFKDGLLARLAHDLRLRVDDLRVTVDPAARTVQATVATASVHVVCFRRDGRDVAAPIGAFERRQIEGHLHDDVLASARYPEARFVSTETGPGADSFTVRGTLTLHGQSRPIVAAVQRQGDRYVATVDLRPSEFGIKPYSAALGALKVKDEVKVVVTVPASAA